MIEVTTVHPLNPTDRPPVLLVHGAANSAPVWRYWQESLAHLGWSSYAVDLRGHGRSPGPVDGASMMDYADDVAEVAAGLSETPVVIGWSMGGLVALMFANRGLDRACVALAPSAPATERDARVEIRRAHSVQRSTASPATTPPISQRCPTWTPRKGWSR